MFAANFYLVVSETGFADVAGPKQNMFGIRSGFRDIAAGKTIVFVYGNDFKALADKERRKLPQLFEFSAAVGDQTDV